MTRIRIPIRFRFLKLPVVWSVDPGFKGETILSGYLQRWKSTPEEVRLVEMDGWKSRDEFFAIPKGDIDALNHFLNKVGVWSPDWEFAALDWSRYPLYVRPDDLWSFREDLRGGLLEEGRVAFTDGVTPVTTPRNLIDLMTPHPANNFPLRFELSNVVSGVVTMTNARQMLFATVLADVARGIRFKTCKRKDCLKPFPLQSKHARKFCCWYCAHITTVRRNRPPSRHNNKKSVRGS